jgi:hypothetical protein
MSTLNRRHFLKCASATAAAAYGFSRFPLAFGQEVTNGIDCGTVVTVPTFTGAVDQSWYGDTNDYKATAMTNIPDQTTQYPIEGHLRTKFNEYTWFGIEAPTSTDRRGAPSLVLLFDTLNKGITGQGAEGVYNLVINSGTTEIEYVEDSTGKKFYWSGTALFRNFSRGTDYDWKYSFSPSVLSPTSHAQFNVKIKTTILTKYFDKVNIYFIFFDDRGQIHWAPSWEKLNYVQQALPEFGLKEAVAATALGAGLVAAKVAKCKKEWSRREFLRFPKIVTESLL